MLSAVALALVLIPGARADEQVSLPGSAEPAKLVGRTVRVETLGRGIFQGTLHSVGNDRLEIVESEDQAC